MTNTLLEKYRNEIDQIDIQIKNLILQRKAVVEKVFQFKIENKLNLYAPSREQEILINLLNDISKSDPFYDHMKFIIETLVQENRKYMESLSHKIST